MNTLNLILYIGEGAGLACAAGLRPFLPALAAGVLAGAGLELYRGVGLDFAHTDFSFLQSTGFLLAVVVLLAASLLALRTLGAERFEEGPSGAAVAGLGIGLGAVLFAAVLAEHHDSPWPGLVAGALCATLAQFAARGLLARTRARLAAGAARDALTVYVDGVALLLAAVAVFLPPASFLALAFFARLLLGARRRAAEKYAGLRILK
ncbi:MAG: hypothetical protein QOF77_1431 [Solirubrobacteraceae bacterium]|jgi:hypothetical protein|nr:hypothetical protein [Solirubrobacteraceae bacterium]